MSREDEKCIKETYASILTQVKRIQHVKEMINQSIYSSSENNLCPEWNLQLKYISCSFEKKSMTCRWYSKSAHNIFKFILAIYKQRWGYLFPWSRIVQ